MTASNVLGPSLSLGRLERAVMAHVRLWLPTYLREAERAEGVQADGVTPLQPGSVPLPRSFRPTDGRVDKWPEDQLPALIFGSPGLANGGLRRDGRGEYRGTWVVQLTAVASGRDDTTTRWLAGIYCVALRLLLVQQPKVAGLDVDGIAYEDEAYDRLPFSRGRSLMAGSVSFTLGAGAVASARGGVSAPLPSPTTDPGPPPEVTETDVTIERRGTLA